MKERGKGRRRQGREEWEGGGVRSGREGEEGKRRRVCEEREKKEGLTKIVFRNVAGLRNQDEGFWKELGKWDVIGLIETWVVEKG